MTDGSFILIIDRDPEALQLLGSLLIESRYQILYANNATQGLALLENNRIDLIFCEVALPEIDGLTFLKKSRVLKPQVPVIMMSLKPTLSKIKKAMHDGAIDFLQKPLKAKSVLQSVESYSSQRFPRRVVRLKDCIALLISSDDRDNRPIYKALLGTIGHLSVAATPEEGLDMAQDTPYNLIIYCMGDEDPDQEVFERFYELRPNVRTFCIVPRYDTEQLPKVMSMTHIDTLMIRNGSFSEPDFMIEVRKLFCKDIFGLEKYLMWGAEAIQSVTHHTNDRFRFVDEMADYLERLKIAKVFISKMQNVADEFLSNALYNAPIGKDGAQLYLSRTESHKCSEREQSLFSYAYDGRYFAVSMVDYFGSVTKQQIFNRIKRCLDEQGRPSLGKGGAGLGLYLSFLTLNRFIINIEPGQKTEMIGLCDIRSSFKQSNLKDKSLSIFVGDS